MCAAAAADVDGFSQFLAEQKALPTLLFWKDAEDFTTLFGVQERAESAKKIFDRYLKTGADYEVHASQQAINDIIKSLGEPPEDLFEPLQQDSYNTMLFELFPAFWEAIKKQDVAEGSSKRSQLTTKTTLAEVLKANDLEIHLFAEYCREHMCEESVTFLLECGMYALLFDPLDLETQARRIYELYIDDASEGRISGISAVISDKIKSVLEKANVLQKSDVKERKSTRRESTTTGIDSSLFQKAAEEVMQTLNMDVWPRYKEAVLNNQSLTLSDVRTSVAGSGGTPADDRKATKANTLEAMKDKEKLEYMREVISTHDNLQRTHHLSPPLYTTHLSCHTGGQLPRHARECELCGRGGGIQASIYRSRQKAASGSNLRDLRRSRRGSTREPAGYHVASHRIGAAQV